MDSFYINGTLLDGRFDIGRLLKSNSVYAAVYTDEHKPLNLDSHLSYASASYRHLYGLVPILDTQSMANEITDLLGRNRRPSTGNIVYVHLIPQDDPKQQPDIVITCGESSIYHGYTLFTLRPTAIIANYEIPFSGHRTSASLSTASFMEEYAKRSGAHITLRANRSGMLVSSGDYPILARRGDELYTPLPERGAGNSVERDIMFKACSMAGLTVTEADIEVASISSLDEIVVFGSAGVSSILSCSGNYYLNLTSERLESIINSI